MRVSQLMIFGFVPVLWAAGCTQWTIDPPADDAPAAPPASTEPTPPASETPPSTETPPPSETAEPAPLDAEELPATSLVSDFCDEPTFAGVSWVQSTSNKITVKYLPGTAVETDLETILAVRNDAYAKISTALGVADAGIVTVQLSPNRAAAHHHGLAKGRAYPSSNRIEAVYLAHPDAYENKHYGHELTHVIAWKVDPTFHVPMIEEGLAEVFDQSGRDVHASYVAQLRAGVDSAHVTRFSDWDVAGRNYGRAGSWVKFLIGRYGMEKFLSFYKASAVTWSGSTYTTKLGDKVVTPADLELASDRALRSVYGKGFEAIRLEWQAVLDPYLIAAAPSLSSSDVSEIKNVVANVDRAYNTGNASVLRSALEGFYCDGTTDDQRATLAKSVTEGRGTVKTKLVDVNAIGTKNYRYALAHLLREETRNGVTTSTVTRAWFEKYPVGWRINAVDSW